jgi:hypothetical protein
MVSAASFDSHDVCVSEVVGHDSVGFIIIRHFSASVRRAGGTHMVSGPSDGVQVSSVDRDPQLH